MSGLVIKPPGYIVVEGPIRVGKSTLARILAERLHARRIFDPEDNPLPEGFYREKPGAAFARRCISDRAPPPAGEACG